MAMLDVYGPTTAEIRAAFHKAAGEGQKYLLMLEESTNDVMLVTIHGFTRPVADQSAIVPLLRDLNKECYLWGDTRLKGVFDLAKSFDAQIGQPYADGLKNNLSSGVQAELVAYGQEMRLKRAQKEQEMGLKRAQKEWDRQPWLSRLFSSRPV